jgi:hypothetical protein
MSSNGFMVFIFPSALSASPRDAIPAVLALLVSDLVNAMVL